MQAMMGGHKLCADCSQPVTPEQKSVEAFERVFHASCFVCKACASDLSPLLLIGQVPPTREGLLFCKADYRVSCSEIWMDG